MKRIVTVLLIVLGLFFLSCKQSNNKSANNTIKSATLTESVVSEEVEEDVKPLETDELEISNEIDYSAEEIDPKQKINFIKNIITAFAEQNRDEIANLISYPLTRIHPLPNIKSKNELKQRFDEIFDEFLIDKIANSTVDQWEEVGWKGVMLDNGIVWMDPYDGKITAINYQTDLATQRFESLISKEKNSLHASLQNFNRPICKIKTKRYLIRIDETDKGYRYASWKIKSNESSKPDIILENGKWQAEGTGGDHSYHFMKNEFKYVIYIHVLQDVGQDYDATLDVLQNDETILSQNGVCIKN